MYSSAGRCPVGSWHCQGCSSGSGEVILSPDDFDHLRDDAVRHLQATGHQVTLLRGSREDLTPMRTEVP